MERCQARYVGSLSTFVLLCSWTAACSSDSDSPSAPSASTSAGQGAPAAAGAGPEQGAAAAGAGAAAASAGAGPGPAAMSGAGAGASQPSATAGAGAPMSMMPTTPTIPSMPTMPPGMAGMMPPATGPVDGDPSKPMVSIPGVPCGPPRVSFGGDPQTVKITDRDVHVSYPCAHEGAQVTFFLFVHGTLQEAQKLPFTLNAYAVHELVDSHNVIVVAPKAIGTQWGREDNGADLPHLYDVVNWTYATFGEKFNIRSMWAHGGSWGAFYLSTFACDAMLEDKLNGVYMVVGGGCPRCSDRLSCVVIQQELEKGMGMTLDPMAQEMLVDAANISPYAMMHGCDPKMGPTNVGNVRAWDFPNCDPGWLHGYYLGPGEHADKLDQAAVVKLTELMKATEN